MTIGPLPDWADKRLVVRLNSSDELYVIDGNAHTYRGRVELYNLAEGYGIAVFPREIVATTDYARGWLEGFSVETSPHCRTRLQSPTCAVPANSSTSTPTNANSGRRTAACTGYARAAKITAPQP